MASFCRSILHVFYISARLRSVVMLSVSISIFSGFMDLFRILDNPWDLQCCLFALSCLIILSGDFIFNIEGSLDWGDEKGFIFSVILVCGWLNTIYFGLVERVRFGWGSQNVFYILKNFFDLVFGFEFLMSFSRVIDLNNWRAYPWSGQSSFYGTWFSWRFEFFSYFWQWHGGLLWVLFCSIRVC